MPKKSDSREKWILRDICPYKTISKRKFSNRLVSRILFNSNISVVKGDTVFLRGYRISDKSYNGFDYLDLTCSDIIGIHNL